MTENGLSLGEAMALTDRRDDGMFGGGASWIFILFFFWIFMFNGNGWGGNSMEGIATREAVNSGFQYNQLDNGIRSIQNGLCDGIYALNNAVKDCCCSTKSAIQDVRYDMSKGFCDVITASNLNTRDILEAQNSGVQRILDYLCENEKTALRERISTLETSALLQNQSANLINQLKPFPVPAYLTASPYASYPYGTYGAYGYGYGLNSGCGCAL